MKMISRILDWVNPDRVTYRAENEKIAQSFFALVQARTWSMECMCEAVTLLPSDRYEKVNGLLSSMFAEAKAK